MLIAILCLIGVLLAGVALVYRLVRHLDRQLGLLEHDVRDLVARPPRACAWDKTPEGQRIHVTREAVRERLARRGR